MARRSASSRARSRPPQGNKGLSKYAQVWPVPLCKAVARGIELVLSGNSQYWSGSPSSKMEVVAGPYCGNNKAFTTTSVPNPFTTMPDTTSEKSEMSVSRPPLGQGQPVRQVDFSQEKRPCRQCLVQTTQQGRQLLFDNTKEEGRHDSTIFWKPK